MTLSFFTRRLAAASLLLAGGCAAAMANDIAQLQQQNYNQALGGPSHPETTATQWQELDGKATELAKASGAPTVLPPARLSSKELVQNPSASKTCLAGDGQTRMILCVEKALQLKGKTCYTVAAAWAYSNPAQVSVGFTPGPDGKVASDSFASRGFKLDAPGGTGTFCTDRAGAATLTIAALSAQGAMAINELLEYSVAIGEKPESSKEAASRQKADSAQAENIRGQMEANVAAAKERERRNQEARCRDCSDSYRACQVDRAHARQYPRPGVSYSTSCESQYQLCAFGGSHFDAQRHAGERPCGDPPR